MTGPVEWPILIAMIVAILAVAGFACGVIVGAWRKLDNMREVYTEELRETRHSISSKIEQGRVALEAKVDAIENAMVIETRALDARLRAVEADRMLTGLLRDDFREFRAAIDRQLTELRAERKADMNAIHKRFNDILMLPPSPPAGRE